MAQSTDGVPYGQIIIDWWERSDPGSDPDEAHDWLTQEVDRLAERFRQEFSGTVYYVRAES